MELVTAGIWNIPGREKEITGDLYMDHSQGVLLVLYSSERIGLFHEFETITGKTTTGSKLTLYNCEILRESIHIGAEKENETHIVADYLFDGIFLSSKEDLVFYNVCFRFTNLDEWAYYKGFELNTAENCSFSLKYNAPEEAVFVVDDNTTLKLICGLKAPMLTIVDKEIKVTQSVYAFIEHNEPQPLEKSLSVLKPLMSFVSLCLGQAVDIINIVGQNPSHYQIIDDKGNKIYHNIPIYMTGMANEDYTPIDPRLVLLNLQTVIEDFQLYMRNWYDKSELLQPVIEQYLSIYYSKGISIEQHFLALVRAVESFHRRTRNNFEIDKKSHKKRIEEIVDSAPEEHRGWLKEKLSYSNEATLKGRLDELMHDKHDYWLFLNDVKERKSFTVDVKNTRNYLTHYDKKLEKKALRGEQLEATCFYLKTMLEYYLLKEIGLPIDLIREKTIERLNRFRNLREAKRYMRKQKDHNSN